MHTWALAVLAAVAPLVAVPAAAVAEEYPARAIRAIVGFPPGSGADILARYYSRKLSDLAGKPVVVENKPGASSNIAVGLVAQARPDGYTLLYASNSTMAGSRFLFKSLPFDTVADFAPVALLSQTTFVLAVSSRSPHTSVAALTAHLEGGQHARYAITNQVAQIATELYKSTAGFTAVAVPYRTAPEVMPDIANGTIDFMIIDGTFGSGQIQAGRLRPLAVTTAVRLPTLPDVPTMQEAGVPGYDFASWWAVWLPKGAPPEIVTRLGRWYGEITGSQETRAFLAPIAGTPLHGDTAAARARQLAEIDKWSRIVAAAGIVPE